MAVETTHFVQLHPEDNVVVCCIDAAKDEWVLLNNQRFQLKSHIEVGHKVACQPIYQGQKIIKYGVAIGSATRDIALGEHAHLANVKSDYIASHTRLGVTGTHKE